MNTNQHLENHYRSLCHKLNEQVYLLEKMLKKKKIEKKDIQKKKKSNLDPVGKEDADVDNDGRKNTSTDKYIKNRREKISQEMKKKKSINEGYAITDGNIFYGGFPKKLNETNQGATERFNDSGDTGQINVATLPDDKEMSLGDMEKLHAEMIARNIGIERDYDEPGERRGLGTRAREELYAPANALRARIEAHPDFIARQNIEWPPRFHFSPETEQRKIGRRIG